MEYILGYNLFESFSKEPTFGKNNGNLVVNIDGKTLTFKIFAYAKVPFVGEQRVSLELKKISLNRKDIPDVEIEREEPGTIYFELDPGKVARNQKTFLSPSRKNKIIEKIRNNFKSIKPGFLITSLPENEKQKKFELELLSVN